MSLYEQLEEKYYALMEKLRLVDVFVRPIEERGIPSFPIAVLLLVLIVTGVAFAAWTFFAVPPSQPVQAFRITVRSADGSLLDGALVEVWDGSDKIASKQTRKGVASFDSLPAKTLTVRASKAGFQDAEVDVDFTSRKEYSITLLSLEEGTAAWEEYEKRKREEEQEFKTKDPDGETLEAKLDVYVKNPEGRGIDAIVRVFNAENGVQIGGDLKAVGGRAAKDGLEKGQKIFLMIEASGANANDFLPYDGSGEKHTLRVGNNVITKYLKRSRSPASPTPPCVTPPCPSQTPTPPPGPNDALNTTVRVR
ncbi:MAG: carboxypeptidase-like regulatory domain-containing protein, partial [Candidatus Norongarragalinales archaeon]